MTRNEIRLAELRDDYGIDIELYKDEVDEITANGRSYNLFIEKLCKFRNNDEFKTIEFTYDKEVRPAPRPRGRVVGKVIKRAPRIIMNPRIIWHDPGSKDKKDISDFIKKNVIDGDHELIDGEIHVEMTIYKETLKGFSKADKLLAEMGLIRPEKKPDVDNYSKTLLDALNDVVWKDDSVITTMTVHKYYSSNPRTDVIIKYRNERRNL